MFAKFKKAFTLIEMLIVVVIIGILAAALIPRLQSVQGKARDTKRKADLSQIGSALAVYKSDNSSFSALSGSSKTSQLPLTGSYMTAVPTDSDLTQWYDNSTPITGYAFASLQRNGSSDIAFGLMARTETDGSSSNWVTSGAAATTGAGALLQGSDVSQYESSLCKTTLLGTASTSLVAGWTCTANKSSTDLRYVYFQ